MFYKAAFYNLSQLYGFKNVTTLSFNCMKGILVSEVLLVTFQPIIAKNISFLVLISNIKQKRRKTTHTNPV